MKYLLSFVCFAVVHTVLRAQSIPAYGVDKVRIVEPEKIIIAEFKPVSKAPSTHNNLLYFWYSANKIHATQGGFSGQLLNGSYTELYPDRNLKLQGNFKKGLKDGPWKSWDDTGGMTAIIRWQRGTIVADSSLSFWKRINIFRRRAKDTSAFKSEKQH